VPRTQGFTLVELMLVLAIVGVMMGAGLASLQGVKNRADFSQQTGDLVAAIRRTRAEAIGRGSITTFIVDTVGKRWWSLVTTTGFDLTNFNPALPQNSGELLVSGSLSPPKVDFAPAGYGALLPAPFASVPTMTGQAPAYVYCSFCLTGGGNTGFGSISFEPGHDIQFSPVAGNGYRTPGMLGEQFTLGGDLGNGSMRTIAVAVIANTGVVEVFER
jgi:prepilin-type N-terminal cleavage/methylation domain-containing protein